MECHIKCDLKMVGSHTYTQGTIEVHHKQKTATIEQFIVICSKDISTNTPNTTGKCKLNENGKETQQSSELNDDTYCDRKKKKCDRKREKWTWEAPLLQYNSEIKNSKFILPQITMSNVRSLPQQMKDLILLVQDSNHVINKSELIFFTETWLDEWSPSVRLENYKDFRENRDKKKTKKESGGGSIAYIKVDWAEEIDKIQSINEPSYELMTLRIKPKDSEPIVFILVYVPGHAFSYAATEIAEEYKQRSSNGDPVFLLGDFNLCKVSSILTNLQQYVTCPTRKNNILDLCYGNVLEAYRCECSIPLGRSDHNVIHLIPRESVNNDKTCEHEQVKLREQRRKAEAEQQ